MRPADFQKKMILFWFCRRWNRLESVLEIGYCLVLLCRPGTAISAVGRTFGYADLRICLPEMRPRLRAPVAYARGADAQVSQMRHRQTGQAAFFFQRPHRRSGAFALRRRRVPGRFLPVFAHMLQRQVPARLRPRTARPPSLPVRFPLVFGRVRGPADRDSRLLHSV